MLFMIDPRCVSPSQYTSRITALSAFSQLVQPGFGTSQELRTLFLMMALLRCWGLTFTDNCGQERSCGSHGGGKVSSS